CGPGKRPNSRTSTRATSPQPGTEARISLPERAGTAPPASGSPRIEMVPPVAKRTSEGRWAGGGAGDDAGTVTARPRGGAEGGAGRRSGGRPFTRQLIAVVDLDLHDPLDQRPRGRVQQVAVEDLLVTFDLVGLASPGVVLPAVEGRGDVSRRGQRCGGLAQLD